ncbi:MAG: arginine deiminase-related protein [Patescibacteria group bacterium]|nr:arginine deiminase-related protein [Patescibacteria group bacterium]
MPKINQHVLMSGVDYFSDEFAINAYMGHSVPIDINKAKAEHQAIKKALESAGVKVTVVPPPKNCQDGVYTANWALCKDDKAIMARLPNKRKGEEPYAREVLKNLGKEIITVPENLKFSGQGDALPCGNDLFCGSNYRTDFEVHKFLKDQLGFNIISLQTIPKRAFHGLGRRVINKATGWPDSFYYDIDLALSVIKAPEGDQKGIIAWCPEAFTRKSRALLNAYDGVEKIEVSRIEATKGFACNLVSTGETVIMSDNAPLLKAELTKRGFKIITPEITELAKGGGYIRCTTLTLQ